MTSPLEAYKQACDRHFYMESKDHVDIVFGAIFANALDDDPVWMFLVGPPSSGKTAVLMPASQHPLIYALSKLTPKSLISHHAGPDGRDPSLLPKLDGKILIIKDFTEMLSMRNHDLHDILGQLRDAYDGESASKAGIGQVKRFKSRFGVIAAVTGSIDRQRHLMTELGERFLTYRMPPLSEREKRERQKIATNRDKRQAMEGALQEAAFAVMNQPVREPKMHQSLKNKIYVVANYVAKGRTEVCRDSWSKEPELPEIEEPVRLTKQLVNLAKGIAMARGKSRVDGWDVMLVRRTALHCMTARRLRLLKTMLADYPKQKSIKEMCAVMHAKDETMRRRLEDLELLGLARRKKVAGESGKMHWEYSLEHAEMLNDLFRAEEPGAPFYEVERSRR